MPDHIDISVAISRIQKMELYLDEILYVLENAPDTVAQNICIREMIRELACYYENGQWLSDYELDENGKLPADLKRGVLAQDTLYDLLSELKERGFGI